MNDRIGIDDGKQTNGIGWDAVQLWNVVLLLDWLAVVTTASGYRRFSSVQQATDMLIKNTLEKLFM